MGNAKRFLSVILAMIMLCSTLVIGANAAYTAYKDSAIINQYNKLDKAVLTTDQYASAALDEIDRMLTKEQLKFTREDIIVGDIDLTSVDAAMDSVYAIVHGALFSSLKGMLGDLQNLNVEAFAYESAGGVRRGTAGKTDTDILYAVFQFLYDNKDLLSSFVAGTLDTGSLLSSLIDLSEFLDVNKLLKGMLYEFAYGVEGTDEQVVASSVDTMAQDLIDKYVVTGYDEENDDGTIEHVEGLVPALEGKTNISTGTAYTFLDNVIKVLYNEILIPIINEDLGETIKKFCGVEYIDNGDGTYTLDYSNLNEYANILNVDYEVPAYEFTDGTFISQGNNIIKSIFDAIINPEVLVWEAGDQSQLKPNLVNVAKELLITAGDELFADYIELASAEEIEAMGDEELVIYAIRAIINSSAYGMYVPETSTIREFAFLALQQVLATDVPELDLSNLDPNSTDSIVILGINYAIHAVSAEIDMGLEFVYDMEGVDAQLKKAADYAVDNYSGVLNGITFDENATGWETIDKVIFSIIPENWLPTVANGSMKTFIFTLVDAIADLDFDSLFAMFEYRSDSELQKTPKQVIINLVTRIVNIIFPGAFKASTSLDALVTNAALASTVDMIFTDLYTYRENLAQAILPVICSILDLTNAQEFEFPELNWDPTDANVDGNSISTAGSIALKLMVRNGSTGINTGYTDANGVFHQDSLYTYDIQSVTTNIAAISATYPDTIAGGQTAEFSFTGSVSASTPFVVTITYDVLTEDGSPLTDAPITETMYSYIAYNEAPDNETKLTSTASGGYSITDGPRYLYANSFGDLTDITVTVQNTNAAEATAVPYVLKALESLVTTDDTCYLQLVTEAATIMQQVDDTAGIGNVKVFEETEAYDALTGEEKDAAWLSMIENNTMYNATTGLVSRYPTISYTLGATVGSTTLKNTAARIYLYNDFGLPGLLESEMGKHRQQSAYATADTTLSYIDPLDTTKTDIFAGLSVWEAYVVAMQQAAKAVYSTCRNGTFALGTIKGKARLYEPAFNNLTAAIEELEAQVLSAGVESSQALIDKCFPSNPEDLSYDDPSYVHLGVSDYVAYTYYNFRDELRTLQGMIDAATIPDEETGEVAVVNELTKAYNEHRFSLYYGRLLPRDAVKTHLERELANPTRTIGDSSEYSTESWDNYQKAVNFATSTVNDDASNPTKVKTAYRELLEAEKRLVAPTEGGDVGGDEASYEFTETVVLVEGVETGELFITGINPDNDLADYFVCSGCYVEVTENEGGYYSTGAVVTVKSEADDSVLAAYTVAVYTDITGDGMTDTSEVSQVLVFTAGSDVPSDLGLAAGDVNFDGAIDTSDLSSYLAVAAGSVVVNYETREIA
ncbi:MAG: hypothetical protein IJ447_08935 [Clostridia bacterium]|nr:hypothetical protein [Clostridia bacterium]